MKGVIAGWVEQVVRIFIVLLSLILFIPELSEAVTYFAGTGGSNSNTCVQAQTRATRKLTVNAAVACMSAGDTIIVTPGTYTELLSDILGYTGGPYTIIPGGSSLANRTKIFAETPGTVIMRMTPDANFGLGAEFANADYIHMKDIIFDGNNHLSSGIGLGPGTVGHLYENITIQFTRGIATHIEGDGHQFLNPTMTNIAENTSGVSTCPAGTCGNDPNNPTCIGYCHCFYTFGTNHIVRGGTMTSVSGYIYHMGSGSNHYYDGGVVNGAYGIAVLSSGSGSTVTNVQARNIASYLAYMGPGNNVVHNTVTLRTRPIQVGDASAPIYQNTPGTPGVLKNNLFFNFSTQGGFDYIHILNSQGQNVLATQSLPQVQGNTCDYQQNGCTFFPSGSTFVTNPSAGNFALPSNSVAINRGVNDATVAPYTPDAAGFPRPQGGGRDSGALEALAAGPPPNGNPIYLATNGNDSNDCFVAENSATPKQTLASALGCLSFPGKRLLIQNGSYSGVINSAVIPITGGNGPTFTNATSIEAINSGQVTITLPVGETQNVWFQNASDQFILIKGIIFDSVSRADSNVIAVTNGAHDIRFENVEARNSVLSAVYLTNGPNVTFFNSTIHSSASRGIFVDTSGNNNLLLERVIVRNNTGIGIEVRSGNSNVQLINTLLYQNAGGGFAIRNGASAAKLYHVTAANNSVNGIQCDAGATTFEIRNSIAFGNTSEIVNNCSATTSNNLTTDPLYVNPNTGDFHLQVGSIAINAGVSLSGITTDLDGATRTGNPDIGAYEFTSAVYYVSAGGHGDTPNDNNSCTQAQNNATPKATIANALSNCITGPGAILQIRGGTYSGAITSVVNGSPTRFVTISSFPNETAILTGGINLTSGSNLIFDRLLIDRLATGGSTVLTTNGFSTVAGLTNVILQNSEVRNVVNHVVSITGNGNSIINTTIHHAFIGSVSGQTRGFNGILLSGNNNILRKNTIHSNTGWAIELTGTADAMNDNTIEQNRMFLNGTSDGARNIPKGTLRISNGGRNIVRNNLVYNGVGEGIRLDSNNGTNTANQILNNTIYANGVSGYAGTQEGLVYINSPSTRVQNNITWSNGNDTIIDEGGSSGSIVDHNLSATDPRFVDIPGGNFAVTSGSPAIDTGINLANVSNDFVDTLRPQGITDIGAYEFTGSQIPTPTNFRLSTP